MADVGMECACSSWHTEYIANNTHLLYLKSPSLWETLMQTTHLGTHCNIRVNYLLCSWYEHLADGIQQSDFGILNEKEVPTWSPRYYQSSLDSTLLTKLEWTVQAISVSIDRPQKLSWKSLHQILKSRNFRDDYSERILIIHQNVHPVAWRLPDRRDELRRTCPLSNDPEISTEAEYKNCRYGERSSPLSHTNTIQW